MSSLGRTGTNRGVGVVEVGRARRSVRVAALALAGLLVSTTGCGARWDDEQHASVLARTEGGGGSSADGTGGGASGGRTTTGGAATGSTVAGGASAGGGATSGGATGGGGAATGAIGTDGAAAGGDGAAAGGGGPLACAAPSDAPGVTDTEIAFGTVSSLSGPVPGLGESALRAVQAYAAYRNANGGVCGRQLVVRDGDDGTDNGRHRALVTQLDPQIIGLVGGLGGGDAGSADTVVELGMPVIAGAISEGFQNAATVFDTNPPFADPNQTIGKFRFLVEQGVQTAAVVYLGVDQTRSEILDKQIPQMQAAGIQVVNQQELPLSTLSYDSAARQVANSGADYLLFLADYTQSAAMARAMTDTGYELLFAEYVTAYGPDFIDVAGPGAEGAVSWIRSLPNEEAGSNAEQDLFLEWMAQTAPDTQPDTFAADSWVAASAMASALEALTGPITREALLTQISSMHEFDGGGLFGRIDLGSKLNNGCLVGMRVEGGVWRRFAPASGFLC